MNKKSNYVTKSGIHGLFRLTRPILLLHSYTFLKFTANSIWRGSPPLIVKNSGKNGKCNQYELLQALPKSYCATFKTIFETLAALGACHVTIIGGVVYKNPWFSRFFENLSASFWHLLMNCFFCSKTLSSCCDKHQNFDYGCSSSSENESQSPNFGRFTNFEF